jgi:DinB superfamily
MQTAAERRENIEKIRRLPGEIEAVVRGLTDQQLDTPYRPGGWTVRQVVHHVADSHMNAFIRMKLILTEDNPTIKPYNQDSWAAQPDTVKMPIQHSLAIIRGLHERWSVLLDNVSESGWSRRAQHPESGEMTLESILGIYSGHGAKHVEQIAGLRRARNW